MSEKTKKLIIEGLKKGLERKRLNQTEFAKLINVHRSSVTNWLNGSADIAGSTLLDAIEVLDLHSHFFPGWGKLTKNKDDALMQIKSELEEMRVQMELKDRERDKEMEEMRKLLEDA